MPLRSKDITLRAATASDAETVRWLEEVCMKDYATALWGEWKPSATLDLSGHDMIVHQGEVIGCMATREEPDTFRLTRLYLAPDARNQGVGAACVALVLARARALGVPVRLRVLINNPAIRFYERHGFITEDQSPTHIRMIHVGAAEPKENTT